MDLGTDLAHAQASFLAALLESGLLIPCGVAGVYGHNEVFEDVLERVDRLITGVTRDDEAEFMHFPPATVRTVLERSEFLDWFPHLLGTVSSFVGDAQQHERLREAVRADEDWSDLQAGTDLVLTPAACYPVYPQLSGVLPQSGRLIDISGWVYRHEPSLDPTRLQFFRVREMVLAGDPESAKRWLDTWKQRAIDLLSGLGLRATVVTAADPFFGRGGRLLAANQRDTGLKFELVAPIVSETMQTAVASFNYHRDHFGRCFDIRTASGAVAHSACFGFGMERVVLGLFRQHGLRVADWPGEVHKQLWY